jgi:hypothetical protein
VQVIEAPARPPADGPRARVRSLPTEADTRGWYWTTIERPLAPTGPERPTQDLRRVHAAAIAAFAVQFVVFLLISWRVYDSFTISIDYGIFAQALSQIGSGNLLPESTLSDTAYLSSHFELIMWPIALLYPVVRNAFLLLVIQAAALAAMGYVTTVWTIDHVQRSELTTWWRRTIPVVALVLLAINPIAYATAAQDFHFWPLAALFAVSAARDLTAGRVGRMWVWVALCLLCGDVAGVFVFGVGLSAVLASRSTRGRGLLLMAVGLGWVLLVAATGHNNASHVDLGYAYLADVGRLDDGAAGMAQLAGGVLSDPGTPISTIGERHEPILEYLAAGGGLGLLSPWGLGVPVVALLIAALQASPVFIGHPFQNVVVTPFLVFGTAWLAAWLASRRSATARVLAGTALVLALVIGIGNAWQLTPSTFTGNGVGGLVSEQQADAFAVALAGIPTEAQVIASVPTIGRFAEHEWVYNLERDPYAGVNSIPIRAERVAVVVDRINALQLLSPAEQDAVVAQLLSTGEAEVLVDRDGVTAILWTPPPGRRTLDVGAPG